MCMDSGDTGRPTDCEDKPSKTTTCATVTPKDSKGVKYAAKTCLYWKSCELTELGLETDGTCKTIENALIENATTKCTTARAADNPDDPQDRRGQTGRQIFTSKFSEYCLCTKDYCNGGIPNAGQSQKWTVSGSGGLMMMISFLTSYSTAEIYSNYHLIFAK